MKKIEFSGPEKAELVRRIQLYFRDELDQSIGDLPSEFLLEFFMREIGNRFYNRGLADAHAAMIAKIEDLADVVYQLERPVDLKR